MARPGASWALGGSPPVGLGANIFYLSNKKSVGAENCTAQHNIILALSWRGTDAFRAKQQRGSSISERRTTALRRKAAKMNRALGFLELGEKDSKQKAKVRKNSRLNWI